MANILIGITDSVAEFKTAILIRSLSKLNHTIKVIINNDSPKFIPASLIAAFGIEV